MELTWKDVSPCSYADGQTTFVVAAGQSLKIETSPSGEEILDEEFSESCTVHITVFVKKN